MILLVQEDRSFDHYFGTYKAVRGYGEPNALPGVFKQQGYAVSGFGGELPLFHINATSNGRCTHDITHSWGPQHRSWENGAMDSFVTQHLAVDGATAGPLTMGHYQRADLPVHYALADAFTALRRLSLLGDRPVGPESFDVDLGHDRPGGDRRRAGCRDVRLPRAPAGAREAHMDDDDRAATGSRD